MTSLPKNIPSHLPTIYFPRFQQTSKFKISVTCIGLNTDKTWIRDLLLNNNTRHSGGTVTSDIWLFATKTFRANLFSFQRSLNKNCLMLPTLEKCELRRCIRGDCVWRSSMQRILLYGGTKFHSQDHWSLHWHWRRVVSSQRIALHQLH